MPAPDISVHPNQLPRLGSHAGVNLREDCVFTNDKGEEKKRIRKRATYALEELQGPLGKLLARDEVVLYVARGLAPAGALEQFTLGWYVYDVKLCTLVFTNRRLLQFSVKRRFFGGDTGWNWKRGLRGVYWGDVAEGKVKGWLSKSLPLKYRSGKKETFWRLRSQDGRKIKLLLDALLPKTAAESTAAQGIVSLCPDCVAALTPGVYRCPQCGLTFKDEKTAIWRTILIPGGGDFYTGDRSLGAAHAFAEGLFLVVLASLLLEIFGVVKPSPGEAPATWGAVVGVLIALGIVKLLTAYHSLHAIRTYLPTK